MSLPEQSRLERSSRLRGDCSRFGSESDPTPELTLATDEQEHGRSWAPRLLQCAEEASGLSMDLADPPREGPQRVHVGRDGELVEVRSIIGDVELLST